MKKAIDPKVFGQVCGALQASSAKSAIKIIDEKTTVKATWRFKPDGRNRREEMVVTFGAPDYEVAQFIKKCKKRKDDISLREMQFKNYPAKKG